MRKDNAEKLSAALGKNVNESFQPQDDNGLADITILHHHRLICAMLNTAVHLKKAELKINGGSIKNRRFFV